MVEQVLPMLYLYCYCLYCRWWFWRWILTIIQSSTTVGAMVQIYSLQPRHRWLYQCICQRRRLDAADLRRQLALVYTLASAAVEGDIVELENFVATATLEI